MSTLSTRTANINGQAYGALTAAAAACGISLSGLHEIDAIALCVANLLDTCASAAAGQGYLTGSGSAVTQLTNKGTGVTINTITGAITLNNAALAGAASVTFVVTCSAVRTGDVISVNHASAGTAGAYLTGASTIVNATSFNITVFNATAGSLSEAIVLNYIIERGSST